MNLGLRGNSIRLKLITLIVFIKLLCTSYCWSAGLAYEFLAGKHVKICRVHEGVKLDNCTDYPIRELSYLELLTRADRLELKLKVRSSATGLPIVSFYTEPWNLRVYLPFTYCSSSLRGHEMRNFKSDPTISSLKLTCQDDRLNVYIDLRLKYPIPHVLGKDELISIFRQVDIGGELIRLRLIRRYSYELYTSLADGVIWYNSLRVMNLDGQLVPILENTFSIRETDLELAVAEDRAELSAIALNAGFSLACNATYFSPRTQQVTAFLYLPASRGGQLLLSGEPIFFPPISYRPARGGVFALQQTGLRFLMIPNSTTQVRELLRKLADTSGSVRWAMSAGPMLVADGKPRYDFDREGFGSSGNDIRAPANRTVLWTENFSGSNVKLSIFSGLLRPKYLPKAQAKRLRGLKLKELTELLTDRNASYALNLDGGGSSQCVILGNHIELMNLFEPGYKYRALKTVLGLRINISKHFECKSIGDTYSSDFPIYIVSFPGKLIVNPETSLRDQVVSLDRAVRVQSGYKLCEFKVNRLPRYVALTEVNDNLLLWTLDNNLVPVRARLKLKVINNDTLLLDRDVETTIYGVLLKGFIYNYKLELRVLR